MSCCHSAPLAIGRRRCSLSSNKRRCPLVVLDHGRTGRLPRSSEDRQAIHRGGVPSSLVAASIMLGGMAQRSRFASLTTNSAPAMGTDHDPGSELRGGNTVGWAPNCCISDSSWLGETDCELNTDHATRRRYGRLLRTATPVRSSRPRLLAGHWLVIFRSAPLSRECGHCWANSNHCSHRRSC